VLVVGWCDFVVVVMFLYGLLLEEVVYLFDVELVVCVE